MVVVWCSLVPTALGDERKSAHRLPTLTEAWLIGRGGRLYDDWVAELEADTPKGSHPAYPTSGKVKGYATWRCKECHGWDYRGRDGAYGQGVHYTGIKGVHGVRVMAPEKIQQIIQNETHGFTVETIPAAEMKSLTMFLSRGQIDMDRHIDRKTKSAKGEARHGAPIFQTTCAVCHGLNGKEIKLSTLGEPQSLGPLCRQIPWKVLHKIRSGQPGVSMISLASLEIQRQIDVLAYCQTLPLK